MYKEGNSYKNKYFKLCHYVQQCWRYSSTNEEGTNEASLSSPKGASPMKDIFYGMFGAFAKADTNIASPTQDVVPGVCGAHSKHFY